MKNKRHFAYMLFKIKQKKGKSEKNHGFKRKRAMRCYKLHKTYAKIITTQEKQLGRA